MNLSQLSPIGRSFIFDKYREEDSVSLIKSELELKKYN